MRLNYFISLFFLLCIYHHNHAQCPPSTAGTLSGSMVNILATDTTAAPMYTITPSGLPNTEFIIIQNDSLASDGFGPRIIVSSLDGRVVPADLGLSTCNELCVLPFSYDLQQLQEVVDSLLTAEYIPGTSCCDAAGQFFAGLCDSMHTYGINSGADINNLNDIIVLMGIFSGTSNTSTSLENLIINIGQLNNVATLFGGCIGNISEVCFAVSNTISAMDCYTITLPNSATSVIITPDTIRVAPGSTTTLTASYLPNSSSDSIVWNIINASNSTIHPVTGELTASATIDTALVLAKGVRGCATDQVVVLVDPALSISKTNIAEMPLQTFPNPFEQSMQITFYSKAGNYRVQIISITGKIYYTKDHQLTTGNQFLTIDNINLPSGSYIVRAMGNQMQGHQMIIKQ